MWKGLWSRHFPKPNEMDHRSGKAVAKVVGMPGAEAWIALSKGYELRVELFKYYTPEGKVAKATEAV